MPNEPSTPTPNLVDRILGTFTSSAFTQSTQNLISTLKGQGKTNDEIEKAISDLQESDKAHLAEIKKQQEIIDAAQQTVKANDANFQKLEEAKAALNLEEARLRRQIAERETVMADLETSIANQKKAMDNRQQEIDQLKKELGL